MKLPWVVAVVAAATSGCSFTMNTAPSSPNDRTPETARACTSSYLYPAMDGFGAAVGGYNIGISASADDKVKIYGIEVDKGVGLGLGITQLALYGIATTYGVIQAGRCNTLRHEQNMQTDAEAQARPPPPPPEDFKTPSAMIGDAPAATTHGAQDTAALPEWSAFRRVPLTRAPAASTTIPSRFEPR